MTTNGIDSGYLRGPAYLAEPECVRTVRLLRSRGRGDDSIRVCIMTARRMLRIAAEELDVHDLRDVDADVMRRLLDILVRDHSESTSKGYLAHLGTYILANTGTNPYSGAFGTRRRTVDEVLDSCCGRCRYPELLRGYAADMRRRGLKEITVDHNIRLVTYASESLEAILGGSWDVATVGLDELVALRMGLRTDEKSAKQTIEAFQRFVRFATGRQPLRANLLWNCSDEVAPNRVFITRDQWDALVVDLDPEMRLIFYLGALMGLRRGEMARILVDDIRDGVLTVRGKGHGEGKIVEMAIPAAVMDAIDAYMAVRAHVISLYGDNSEGHLFIQTWKGRGCPMAPSAFTRKIREYGKAHGIRLTTHTLRRLYATTMHDAGVDDDTLRRMMRHTNIHTTMTCYLNADPRRMQAAQTALEAALVG